MTIFKYTNSLNIIVEFENGYKTNTRYDAFKRGEVKNPYDKVIYEIGYIGEGEYTSTNNGKQIKMYRTWLGMLERCYSNKYREKYPTYIDCQVCKEWHNFQNFAKWYVENYYEIEGTRMALDKDILHKGNKEYSPSNCVFLPEFINSLFSKANKIRGEYPIGVCWDKTMHKFKAQCCQNLKEKNKQKILGYFDTPKKAFEAYKKYKEQLIKQIADEYKDKIPKKLYEAMYNYQVEITD